MAEHTTLFSTRTLTRWAACLITVVIFVARLLRGYLAVTKGGEHVMAYLGDNLWIEADPLAHRVITVWAPSQRNAWFHGPMKIVRSGSNGVTSQHVTTGLFFCSANTGATRSGLDAILLRIFTRGSALRATPGWRTKSRWDLWRQNIRLV
jgi:hypothetical protein